MMDGNFSFYDLLRLPLRHQRPVAACSLTILFVAFLAIVLWPRQYVSEAKLYIRLGRESVTLDPTTQVGQNISLSESRENEINSVLEVLQSRSIAAAVVEQLGPEAILDPVEAPGDAVPAARQPTAAARMVARVAGALQWLTGGGPTITRAEKAVSRLQKSLDVQASKKRSNVITVRCVASTPAAAQRILAAVIGAYQQHHLRINQVRGSHAFFTQQTDLLKKQLDDAKQRLRQAKDVGELASVDGRRQILENQLSKVHEQITQTQAKLAGTKAKLTGLEQLIDSVPARLVAEAEAGFDNAAADEMHADLYALQIQEQELAAKFTDEHPQVRAIRRQVAAAQAILQQQPGSRSHVTENQNPAYQQLQLAILQERALEAGLEAELTSLHSDRDQALADMQQLNRHEIEIVEITRDIDLLESSYRRAYAALEQSRLSDALEQQQISNVSVAQEPTFLQKPVTPRKLEILVLAICTAAFVSFGVALLCEQLQETPRTVQEVEHELKLPVLATLRPLSSPRTAEPTTI